jgi:hypothetical protein
MSALTEAGEIISEETARRFFDLPGQNIEPQKKKD